MILDPQVVNLGRPGDLLWAGYSRTSPSLELERAGREEKEPFAIDFNRPFMLTTRQKPEFLRPSEALTWLSKFGSQFRFKDVYIGFSS